MPVKGNIIHQLEYINPNEDLFAIILHKREVEEYILGGRKLSVEGWESITNDYFPTVSLEEFIDDSLDDVVFWADDVVDDDYDNEDECTEEEEDL